MNPGPSEDKLSAKVFNNLFSSTMRPPYEHTTNRPFIYYYVADHGESYKDRQEHGWHIYRCERLFLGTIICP